MRPVRMHLSETHEITQITLHRGEWVQVALALHEYGKEPQYEIVQLQVGESGAPEIRCNLTPIPWNHDAEVADDDDATRPIRAEAARG